VLRATPPPPTRAPPLTPCCAATAAAAQINKTIIVFISASLQGLAKGWHFLLKTSSFFASTAAQPHLFLFFRFFFGDLRFALALCLLSTDNAQNDILLRL
jgi:hypothetical protein